MVSSKCFSGANTKQLDYHIVPTLVDKTPQTVAIHIDSNNITESKIKQINLDDLAQKIIDIGLKCRSSGVRNIVILLILVRSSFHLNQITLKVENIMKVLCATNGFNFICNDQIGQEMIWNDGLHLNNDGTAMLTDNFAKQLNINLGIGFKVNRNFNNEHLDRQLSRAKSLNINICIKDVGHKSQPKQNNKNEFDTSYEILTDSFCKTKKLELNL